MISLTPDFFTGATEFIDNFDENSRIVIPLNLDGSLVDAIVDTGSPYSILSPDIAEDLEIDTNTGLKMPPLNARGVKWEGVSHRLRVRIDNKVSSGNGIDLEVNFFIPLPGQGWPSEYNFVGLDSFLFVLRFAVDPGDNLFYFGQSGHT